MMKLSVCLISMLVIVSCGSSLEDRMNEVKRLELLKRKAYDVVLARQLGYEKFSRQVLQTMVRTLFDRFLTSQKF